MREFSIKVKVIKEGQSKPYTDSEYEYEIEVENQSEHGIKEFCTRFLNPCTQTFEQWNKNDADSYFRGYYTFKKLADNKYRYYVKEPFCD